MTRQKETLSSVLRRGMHVFREWERFQPVPDEKISREAGGSVESRVFVKSKSESRRRRRRDIAKSVPMSSLPFSCPGRRSRTRRIGHKRVANVVCGESPVKAQVSRRMRKRRAWWMRQVVRRLPHLYRKSSPKETCRLAYREVQKLGWSRFWRRVGYYMRFPRRDKISIDMTENRLGRILRVRGSIFKRGEERSLVSRFEKGRWFDLRLRSALGDSDLDISRRYRPRRVRHIKQAANPRFVGEVPPLHSLQDPDEDTTPRASPSREVLPRCNQCGNWVSARRRFFCDDWPGCS